MKHLLLITLLTLVSCGPGKTGKSAPIPAETKFTLIGEAGNDYRLVGVKLKLDLSQINEEQSIHSLLGPNVCKKSLGNNNSVENTGVSDQKFIVESANGGKSGMIRFGHLAYYSVGSNDPLCALFNKEKFNFTFDGTVLTIFAIAPGEKWDGAQNSFRK